MSKLIIHKTPREFLDANYNYLMQNELENNLILGICLGLEDKNIECKDYTFLSVISGEQIEAISFRNTPRIVITGDSENDEAVSKVVEYYQDLKIKIGGVFGEKKISEKFADKTKLNQIKKREMIDHELDKTNNFQLSEGKFKPAEMKDLDLLFEYRIAFDNEAFGYSRLDYDTLKKDLENKIRKNDLYNWICDNEIVSVAAVMRRTTNIGIIGIVFTPEKFRGNGYASSIVLSLSNEILNSGLSKSGLFTDKSNPTSNDIYYKIGYRPKLEYADIYFGS
jgi:predicted GNAT family acetyltransferase